ncbi:chemotaxis protein MotA [Lachnospiraceae bacterium PF1-21]|uniref:MotA/TolQ/ExbB proton channel family protein n=1 Tax=Ohessyouella blattaphilus TaxID=2949333 RepID=A0ABT1EEJ4_9FIRM|nr:MotA/TolQ/ExbB proton channel family protein [Ohessyouella blattaphilus]MCP1109125.1 MotA/TolQ/ExbB proton channel family protein [Ohessyouella blattaphilus]MCR8562519.1 MotA/TolQ/ExbB proton channel family protein [Ohessyouella blattaphilus]MDL2250227.1 MotA/TolQ/ExbB proton channel family protein [Lachnospiraceae bacterium OttesenSCG-928-J05]
MDITTIIGIIGGIAFIVNGIMGSGKLDNFIDPPSVVIVVGGTICAVIASFPLSKLKNVGAHMKKLISGKAYKVEPVINDLVEFAQIARKNGLLALEEKANKLKDPFFKQGIMLVVDATEPDKAREMLEMELDSMIGRHEEEAAIYDKAAAYAPAFGMIGTLIGLINMLKSMDLSEGSSSSLGENMAVAMVTTFYGCMLANLIFAPIAKKLRIRNEEEVLYKQIIIEGVMDIQAGVNPKNVKEKLVSLLPQKRQRLLLEGKGANKGKAKAGGKQKSAEA